LDGRPELSFFDVLVALTMQKKAPQSRVCARA
jgi:hypothetical protein